MIYNVIGLIFPENYVRISMNTKEFDKFIDNELQDVGIVYRYNGARYFFMDEDFVIEELIDGKNRNDP